jgi:KilA-N domain
MNLVTHDWNGSVIAQLAEATKIAKYDVPTGYVNATQMCKACGKLFADYARLDSTEAYWQALSTDMGIPISGLVITIKGGNSKQTQGTWTHPEIAIDLAQWVSVEFRIWANRTLRQVIQGQQEAPEMITPIETPKVIPPVSEERPSLQLISEFYDLTIAKTGIDLHLVTGAKINAMVKRYPILEQEAEIGKALLSVPIENELVRPTQLGEKLEAKTGEKWSAIRVNKALVDQGFQIPNPDGKNPSYLPTEKGKPHSAIVLDTAKSRDKTVQSLQWHLSVLEALETGDH